MKASERLSEVPPYPFVRWNEACRAATARGIDVIRLDMGNPDLAPPEMVINALCLGARDPGSHGYPGFRGTPDKLIEKARGHAFAIQADDSELEYLKDIYYEAKGWTKQGLIPKAKLVELGMDDVAEVIGV